MIDYITDDEKICLVMQLIRHQGSVNYLVNSGFTYLEIINLLHTLHDKQFIIIVENRLMLTNAGLAELKNINMRLKRKGLYRFLSPSIKHRQRSTNIEEIYIPLYENKK